MKAAVIGAGHIAQQHLAALRELKEVQIVGVCDLSPAMAEMTAERHGIAGHFTDHRAMLERTRPDVVHVTTPVPTHFRLAADALESGAHVFIEKPVTATPQQFDELCELAGRRGRHLVEDQNYLFNDTVREVLDLMHAGELGRVLQVEVGITLDIFCEGSRFRDLNAPHPSLALPGGAIGDFLPHLAYLAYAFVGPHKIVRTSWQRLRSEPPAVDDELRAMVQAERGTASLVFSANSQPDAFWVRVMGTQMRAEAHLFEPRLIVDRQYEGPRPLTPLRNGWNAGRAARRGAIRGLWNRLAGGPGVYHGLWKLIHDTYAALANGSTPPISIEQIRDVNRLVADLTLEENRL